MNFDVRDSGRFIAPILITNDEMLPHIAVKKIQTKSSTGAPYANVFMFLQISINAVDTTV